MPQQCAEPPPRPPPTGAKQGHNPPTTPPPQPDSPGKPPKPHPPNPTHPRGSSPHTRGALPRRRLQPRMRTDHPRIRGEHESQVYPVGVNVGSSPHTRGAPVVVAAPGRLVGIIPAYAGSTEANSLDGQTMADHPRIRGEHEVPEPLLQRGAGSSPHTRGARLRASRPIHSRGIIPAYAGSTLGNPCNTKDRRRDYTSFPLPVTHPSGGGGS